MSRTLESLIDVAEATNPAIPLIPSIPETSVTQTHSGPIPSTFERNLFPPPPKALRTEASKEKEFTLPMGQYMEVKRKMGGSDLPPVSAEASAILVKEYLKTSNSHRERESDSHRERVSDSRREKASDSHQEKASNSQCEKASDSGRGKVYNSRLSRHSSSKGKPKLIVSLPLHPGTQKPKPKHPPQAPPPPPPPAAPVSSAASVIAAAVVSDLAAGNSSSSAGSTSKSRGSKRWC